MDFSPHITKHRGWLLTYGILMIILGIIAFSVAALTTLVSVIFLGILLLIGGVFGLFHSFKFLRYYFASFLLQFITALLFVAAGVLLIKNPVWGAYAITLMLAIFFIATGILRLIAAFSLHLPFRGWRILSGIIGIILGIVVLSYLPAASLVLIGIFIGIDLLFFGWSYVLLALFSKSTGFRRY